MNLNGQALVYQIIDNQSGNPRVIISVKDSADIYVSINNPDIRLGLRGKNLTYQQIVSTDLKQDENMILLLFTTIYELLKINNFNSGILFNDPDYEANRVSRIVCYKFGGTRSLAESRAQACADTYVQSHPNCDFVGIDVSCVFGLDHGLCVASASFICDPIIIFIYGPWGVIPVMY